MRDVNVIAIECMRELENIGINCGNVIKIGVNTRSKKRWGNAGRLETIILLKSIKFFLEKIQTLTD